MSLCGQCLGAFFDSDEQLAATGMVADLSPQERSGSGDPDREGSRRCPRCEGGRLHRQEATSGEARVVLARCGACRGSWLEQGELDRLLAPGHSLRPALEAGRARARAGLSEEEVDFRQPFPWKNLGRGAALVLLCAAGAAAYAHHVALREAAERERARWIRQQGGTGCPCGCDRSEQMAAELREQKAAAPGAIERTLATIAEREAVGYITERMIVHRLRMLDLSRELGRPVPHGAQSLDRCRGPRGERDGLRVCVDLVVHGERMELVNGRAKLSPSLFRLWLEIENTSGEGRRLAPPEIRAGSFHFPVSRWYREGDAGEPWDGALGARQTIRVNVVGYAAEVVQPGTKIRANISLGPLTTGAETTALAAVVLPVPGRLPAGNAQVTVDP